MVNRSVRPLQRTPLRPRPIALVISSILASASANAADAPSVGTPGALEDVIVTAQKRAENLQSVPVSVQTLDTRRLLDLQITSLDGYAQYLTSVSVQSYGPGQAQLYVRGVTNGADGLPVGSQPLVGLYLDEMPVTTIGNSLDVHIYDVARVEALSGPQGTLFGSSSMAGTLRIITNKPDKAGFEAAYDITGNAFTKGDAGGKLEGFVNIPLSDRAAIRLVGFAEHDGGYINNVPGPSEVFPTSGIPRANAGIAKRHFNPVDTSGGRAALRFDLDDQWTITPGIIAQQQDARGVVGFDPAAGDLNISRYLPDDNTDRWWQAMLTVEGRIADFDVVYAGGLLRRRIDSTTDYSDYQFFYDNYYAKTYAGTAYQTYWGDNFRDNRGNLIAPVESAHQVSRFTKQSHELRIATPKDWRLRGVAGIFLQRQSNDWRAEFLIPGLADQYSISNQPGLFYLNSLRRTDRDKALFTDWSYDLTAALTVSGGIREFGYDNTVYGFFGYNGQATFDGYIHPSGEQLCFPGTQATGTQWPCTDTDARATKRGETHRVNLTYRVDSEAMVYATWSTGFRPGGVNRVRTRPAYTPDYLTSFEAGWKTEWLGKRLRFNGAFFFERWKDAQFSVYGTSQIIELLNAGRSEIKGVEVEAVWVPLEALTLTASMTALDGKLKTNACKFASPSLTCTEPAVIYNPDGSVQQALANSVIAPAGTRLPVSAKLKGNVIARYQFRVNGLEAHLQGALVTQGDVVPALAVQQAQQFGKQPGYASYDFTGGVRSGPWEVELFALNAFDRRGESIRFGECVPDGSCPRHIVLPIAPRLVGLSIGRKF